MLGGAKSQLAQASHLEHLHLAGVLHAVEPLDLEQILYPLRAGLFPHLENEESFVSWVLIRLLTFSFSRGLGYEGSKSLFQESWRPLGNLCSKSWPII